MATISEVFVRMFSRGFAVWAFAVFCLAMLALQLASLARANSCTWDEADHTYAAYMQGEGDFGLNPEHPPLVKFLAALPLHALPLKLPAMLDRPYRLQEVIGGREFVFGNDANSILLRARLATLPLTLLLAVVVFLAACEMFGTAAGLIALPLLCFDPTLLAHSALVTTDAGQALFLFSSIYAFYRYVKVPSTSRLLLVGVLGGLALATKHSAVLLLPMLILLAGMEVFRVQRGERLQSSLHFAKAILGVALVSIFVLWAWYGFRFSAREPGLSLHPTMAVQLSRVPSSWEAGGLALLARWHLIPESWIYGFAHVLIQSKAFHSFLFGITYVHPVWFYFPVSMLIKSTLAFLLIAGISVWVVASGRLRCPREILFLLLPAAVYLVFAMAGGMNIGIRHILPIYIFLTVLLGGAAAALIRENRRWLPVMTLLLLLQAASVLHAYPAYVAYANEAFGGPSHVHNLLSDSSADWGQQLKDVKLYLDGHGIRNCWFAYFGEGVAEYSYYGIPCKPLITADSLYFDHPHDVPAVIDGVVLVSGGVLSGFEFGPGALDPYQQFRSQKPIAVIDYGVFVFQGNFAIPLAAALSHVQKAGELLGEGRAPDALAEAGQADTLFPESAMVQEMAGRCLDGVGRSSDANLAYLRALALTQTVEPAFQTALRSSIEKRLASGATGQTP